MGLPKKPVRVYDIVQQLAVVDDDVLERFDVDTIGMGLGFLPKEEDWKEWILPDGTPCLIPDYLNIKKRGKDWVALSEERLELGIQKQGCLYFEQTYYPLGNRNIENDDFSDLKEIKKVD